MNTFLFSFFLRALSAMLSTYITISSLLYFNIITLGGADCRSFQGTSGTKEKDAHRSSVFAAVRDGLEREHAQTLNRKVPTVRDDA